MLGFIIQKLMNKKWMVISLLLGNLLLIAIAAANPMYSQAIMQRTLTQDFSDYMLDKNIHPGLVMVRAGSSVFQKDVPSYMEKVHQEYEDVIKEMDVPKLLEAEWCRKTGVYSISVESEERTMYVNLESFLGIKDHIQIINGEMYSDTIHDHTIDVIVNENTFVTQSLILGEEWIMDGIEDENGEPYRIRIAGIFENISDQDPFWVSSPQSWIDYFIMDEKIFQQLFIDTEKNSGYSRAWYTVFDYEKIRADQAQRLATVTEQAREKLLKNENVGVYIYCQSVLNEFIPKAQKLNTTISVLQAPILVLLAAFIFMVSRQMLDTEQNEISVFKSRGAAGKQIIQMYVWQSILIAGMGLLGGIPLGVMICKVIGASNSFLEFVQRTALQVEISTDVLVYAAAAALFSVCTMVIPVFKFSRINIVAHKRQKNRKSNAPWWQKVFLDVILLAVSLYGLYQFKSQEAYLAEQVMDGASLDPLLYSCSSLFMLGSGLLVQRILPWLIRLIFWIGKKWWSPALYASFMGTIRTRSNQGFLVVFLVITMAMGIFNTQTARTINSNGEEKIRYSIGADLVVQESWTDAKGISADNGLSPDAGNMGSSADSASYKEPDFEKYRKMEGVVSATKVLVDNKASVTVDGSKISNIQLMGIHTKEFGETAWFKDDLMSVHWYEYLNAMSQNMNAILVSANAQKYGYELGDVLYYSDSAGNSTRGIIYGFVDYWPAYVSTTRTAVSGVYRENDNFLIVAHLEQLQSLWGVTPYQVWMRTNGSSQFIYDYAAENEVKFAVFQDAAAELVDLKNDPVFQGTNGILTIGFIIALVLCAVGFLIYWILSIKSRTLQFGIFRAMGMSGKEVLSMLINEQILISGISILAGIVVGSISAALYVPLIQIAYSSADKVIPLDVVSYTEDYLRLGGIIGLMVVICMVILSTLISRIKITQALKLGED